MTDDAAGRIASTAGLGLVERLRQERLAIYRMSPMAFLRGVETDLREAADEIERLQKELDHARKWNAGAFDMP